MGQGNKNRSSEARGQGRPQAMTGLDPLDVPAPEAPVDEAMLFEATEAVVRAIDQQDLRLDEASAVSAAMESPVLAPFDAPAVYQALEFLQRLGYLSAVPARGGAGRAA